MIQSQEEDLIKKFMQGLGTHKETEEEEAEIANFTAQLEKVRTSRKHFRGLLYDALVQRDGYLESFAVSADKEKEKEKAVSCS